MFGYSPDPLSLFYISNVKVPTCTSTPATPNRSLIITEHQQTSADPYLDHTELGSGCPAGFKPAGANLLLHLYTLNIHEEDAPKLLSESSIHDP